MKQDRRMRVSLGLQLFIMAGVIILGGILKFSPSAWNTVHALLIFYCIFVGVYLLLKK